ncbi:MAG: threonine/serine exporter family protein [Planctomycetota bacterium]|nr:threonine/serine exporter family protein [Planctomycetota bacterium]
MRKQRNIRDRQAATMDFATALHSFGAPAHRVEEIVDLLGEKTGERVQLFAVPTALIFTFGEGKKQAVQVQRTRPGDFDLGRLAELETMLRGLGPANKSLKESSKSMRRVLSRAELYTPAQFLLAFSLVSASVSVFMGGSWREILGSLIAGFLVGALLQKPQSLPNLGQVIVPGAALLASFAALILGYVLDASTAIITTASLIVLVPGFTLTTALTELATGHWSSGSARLAAAATNFLLLTFGVALGHAAASHFLPDTAALPLRTTPILLKALALIVAGLSLSVLFKARTQDMKWIVLSVTVAYLASIMSAEMLDPRLSAFAPALAVGLGANIFARLSGHPAALFQVPGVMILVPGSLGLHSLLALLNHDILPGVESGFATFLAASSLVAGLLFANLLIAPKLDAWDSDSVC